jgi:hypothetical protein
MGEEADQIVSFIRGAKERGARDEFILRMLVANGWSERRCFRAFLSYYADLPNAVPLARSKIRPKP